MLASLLIALVILAFLYFLKTKKVGFGTRVILAMLLGVGLGAIFGEEAVKVGTIGSIYVSLIKMIVMPLVIAMIITAVTQLTDPTQLRKLGLKTVALFLATTGIAAVIGILVALVIDPGASVNFVKDASFEAREIPTFDKVLLDLVPSNPVNEMANGKVIPVIIFSLFLAVAILIERARKPETVQPVMDFLNSFAKIMFRVVKLVIALTPYGVFGLMTSMAAKYGLSSLLPLGEVILAVYVACLLHFVITYGSLVTFVARVNPLRFLKKIFPVIAVAFTTRSSYATLPVNMEVITKRVKVSDKIASFVAPLGATINMNGCGGLYPAIVAIFVARVFNIDLVFTDYLLIVGSAMIASIGTAGVPGPATISTTVVLTSLGLPLEGFALVLGIDAIVDMARTAINATGTTVSSLIIANSEGEFDRDAFNNDADEDLETKIA
ncbi:dicarboxylate/amino acid:cation symporter [Tumebacillus avium]|uniref:Dicarboxylate/amino acid:cation symporter n=1 Tax=Tumebacillus avium TaxID=1903704 RepID=A0A1Y0ISH0_9BACL|nr:dicarboxylate/amino acid:cation symporter [Tumebacillus avium]ARU62959.1 dicarboxylate/amino acid:cation symporter [Tumebacillus avium]